MHVTKVLTRHLNIGVNDGRVLIRRLSLDSGPKMGVSSDQRQHRCGSILYVFIRGYVGLTACESVLLLCRYLL